MDDVVRAFIALGSNLGDREAALRSALRSLGSLSGVRIGLVSPLIETAPVGGDAAQGPFLNAAAEVLTSLPPRTLLEAMLSIERQHGRTRTIGGRWEARTLDLDLLLYGDMTIDEPGLHVPHPRMHERSFVLQPLRSVAPAVVHPVLLLTITELHERLCRTSPVS